MVNDKGVKAVPSIRHEAEKSLKDISSGFCGFF